MVSVQRVSYYSFRIKAIFMKTPLRSFPLQNYFLCIALVATLVLLASCGRKNIDKPIIQTFNNSTQVTTSLSGRIYNSNGVVISGAQVTCSGYQTTTDSSGYFQFKHILTQFINQKLFCVLKRIMIIGTTI